MTRTVSFTREVETPFTARAKMLEGIYDMPLEPISRRHWEVEVPDRDDDWNILLVAGPSGAGKSILLQEVYGGPSTIGIDTDRSIFDSIEPGMIATDVAEVLAAVGFNTIPSWRRPYRTLSNGEQFRASLAAILIQGRRTGLAVADEFTSVVDRHVAKIAAHAAAKFVRRHNFKFVAATCHEDVIDWLQPDVVVRPDSGSCSWRSVQPRPRVEIEISRCGYDKWKTFAPFHYLTANLVRAGRCFLAQSDGMDVSFTANLFRPMSNGRKNIISASRTVTLPDWQGLGVGMLLTDVVASAYTGLGYRYHSYPSHPAYRAQRRKSPNWALVRDSAVTGASRTSKKVKTSGYRATPAYRYIGEPMEEDLALAFTGFKKYTGP